MNEEWNKDMQPNQQEGSGIFDENHNVTEYPADDLAEPLEENTHTYHWVNPEYQRRREMEGQNFSQAENNHDTINHTANHTTVDRMQNQIPLAGTRIYGESTAMPQKEKRTGRSSGRKIVSTIGYAVLFGVIAGGVMLGIYRAGLKGMPTPVQQEKQEVIQIPSTQDLLEDEIEKAEVISESSGNRDLSVAEVASICMPSVVSITNASVENVRDFFGGVQSYPITSTGSGIIVGQNEKELLIATNSHVVEKAETITVAFSDDAVYEAQEKGADVEKDLAVIAVKLSDLSEETLGTIKVMSIGDSDSLVIGEQVVAIGNALGYGQSVTSGYVSAMGRTVSDSSGISMEGLIQTDTAINPGNSGGALLNMRGELIGINSAKAAATEVEGMGYAIPISAAFPILDELMNRQTRYKVKDEEKAAYIGVTCMNVDTASAEKYGIPLGAFVGSVEENGPADKAGIQKGDVITQLDGSKVYGSAELINQLLYYEAGEVVEVVISRAEAGTYQEHTFTITLGRRKDMKIE